MKFKCFSRIDVFATSCCLIVLWLDLCVAQFVQPRPFPQSPVVPLKARRYEHSDSRCHDELLTYNPEEVITVNTRYGRVTGRYSYLCDHPGVPERDRPSFTYDRNNPLYNYHQYRPRPRIRANVTVFLGIPYAKPPTLEHNLRFKVREIKIDRVQHVFIVILYLITATTAA